MSWNSRRWSGMCHLCCLLTECGIRKQFSLFLPQAPLLGRNYVFILLTFSASFNSFLGPSSWHNETWCCTFRVWLQTLPCLWLSLAKSHCWVVPSSNYGSFPCARESKGHEKIQNSPRDRWTLTAHLYSWTVNTQCPAQAEEGHLFLMASWLL